MMQKFLVRRAADVRTLLDRGGLDGARVPLRNGGTLPAAMFAKVALDDLAWLAALEGGGDDVDGRQWGRVAEDIELLHEVALTLGYANAEQERVYA